MKTVAVALAGAVAGYGFALLAGAIAIAYLSVQKLVLGVVWSSLSAGYVWLTFNSITLAVREIRGASGTLFRGADSKTLKEVVNCLNDLMIQS